MDKHNITKSQFNEFIIHQLKNCKLREETCNLLDLREIIIDRVIWIFTYYYNVNFVVKRPQIFLLVVYASYNIAEDVWSP